MSESNDPLSSVPNNSLLGMSFTPDESVMESSESTNESNEIPTLDNIPEIIRATWELDSQVPPLGGHVDGKVYTLHKLENVVEMTREELDSATLDTMQQVMKNNPKGLVAFPFELPDDGDDFLQQLPRLVWTDEIEGVAVVYETNSMLTATELEAAPEDPEERGKYVNKVTEGREKSRFVVAATRDEVWSIVHPKFESDPENIEQGPALVLDILEFILQGRDGRPAEG